MKSIYIFLSRSNTICSRMIFALTGDPYTHVSISFENELNTLYSSCRKNGYTLLPSGPCREFLNRGILSQWGETPCALYELQVEDEVYEQARQMAERMVSNERYRYNYFGLLLCKLNIRLPRRRHYFCSQFVGEVLDKSQALELPKDSTLMRPSDFLALSGMRCLYRGLLKDLPQRQQMPVVEPVSMTVIYLRVFWEAARRHWQGRV